MSPCEIYFFFFLLPPKDLKCKILYLGHGGHWIVLKNPHWYMQSFWIGSVPSFSFSFLPSPSAMLPPSLQRMLSTLKKIKAIRAFGHSFQSTVAAALDLVCLCLQNNLCFFSFCHYSATPVFKSWPLESCVGSVVDRCPSFRLSIVGTMFSIIVTCTVWISSQQRRSELWEYSKIMLPSTWPSYMQALWNSISPPCSVLPSHTSFFLTKKYHSWVGI